MLSTDADIQFYVLLISAPEAPGAYLTLVRYTDDVRQANSNMINSNEMFSRTIYELNYLGADNPVTIEEYVPRDIGLGEFLSWQLARRIESKLTEAIEVSNVTFGKCSGQYEHGEFTFTLDVAPITPEPMNEATVQEVFQVSTDVIARVLEDYQFESFNAIRLIHAFSGRNLVLPRSHLKPLR